jgi:SAM-dependent methyltransferase
VYGQSARIYDLLYSGGGIKDYPVEALELHRVISQASPGARTLLDVACGTGAHLAELRRWYVIEGADISPAMLEVARRRLIDVPLHEADMRSIDLGRTFDAVTCLFSSIGYITEPGELTPTIARLAAHLAPGGVLIVDGWLRPEAWLEGHRPGPDIADDGELTVVRLTRSRRDGNITELDMHHLVRSDSGIDYFEESHRLALVPTGEYVAAFEAAGLETNVIPDCMPGRDRIVGRASSTLS